MGLPGGEDETLDVVVDGAESLAFVKLGRGRSTVPNSTLHWTQ